MSRFFFVTGQWILHHPKYTLQNNFISQNVYLCIELNAHAIISLLILLRDSHKNDGAFLPWLLGSQTCEKTFRLARSTTSTFSTIINFSMLGLMRRLHRLQIQSQLQAESHASEVIYPQVKKHKKKDGRRGFVIHSLKDITNDKICQAVTIANIKAKEAIEKLGMDVHNVEKDEDGNDENRDSDTDIDHDEQLDKDTGIINNVVKEVCMEDSQDLKTDIQSLSGFISDGVKTNLCHLQSALSKISTTSNKCATQTYTPLLELSNGTSIRKTTAVWLFQEGERVSSDRLFRVRAKQPFNTDSTATRSDTSSRVNGALPQVMETVEVGEMWVFNKDNG